MLKKYVSIISVLVGIVMVIVLGQPLYAFAKTNAITQIPRVFLNHIEQGKNGIINKITRGMPRLEYALGSDHQWEDLKLFPKPATETVAPLYDGYGGHVGNLLAIPISSSEIGLAWEWIGDVATHYYLYYSLEDYPVIVGGELASAPLSEEIYNGGTTAYAHKGLNPGTTYYYTIYEEDSATYDNDFATTLMGKGGELEVPMPPEWFQDPQCTAYEQLPIWSGIEGFAEGFEIPTNNFCLALTLGGIMAITLGGWLLTRTSAITLTIPFVAIIVAAIAGLLPMWLLAFDAILAGLLVFIWLRA